MLKFPSINLQILTSHLQERSCPNLGQSHHSRSEGEFCQYDLHSCIIVLRGGSVGSLSGIGWTIREGKAMLLQFSKLQNSAYMGKFCQFVFRIFEVWWIFGSIYLPCNIMTQLQFFTHFDCFNPNPGCWITCRLSCSCGNFQCFRIFSTCVIWVKSICIRVSW